LARVGAATLALSAGGAIGSGLIAAHTDAPGDARLRRTDAGLSASISTLALPDIVSVTLQGWTSPTAVSDPYRGSVIDPSQAHLFRLDIVMSGLACPPGTLGFGGAPYFPTEFGVNPVYGFIDIDVDNDIDTGGELGGAATNRYLANVGRFGVVPRGPLGERMARSDADIDLTFQSSPQYERSGADFALSLCGCFHTTIAQRISGNADDVFEPGETWIVRGRFFERAGGYQGASFAFGGSAFGLYDPLVNLRYSHDLAANQTTISLIYPLDMVGAGLLTGQPVQEPDSNVANHTSVEEALQDVIDANNAGIVTGPALVLSNRWFKRLASDYLDPTTWSVTGLLGVAYATAQPFLYAWTDTLGDALVGDFNGDGVVDAADRGLFQSTLSLLDGGPDDCDGATDGVFTVCIPGPDWTLYDLTGDGRVNVLDYNLLLPPCSGDCNGDRAVDFVDLDVVLGHYGLHDSITPADFNHDGVVDFIDLNILLCAFGQPCP
jgi:hypothetical protein